MANQRDLKAFVRFDGSGRVVAGSLILRKNKPRVGRWQEIPAYECCNYVPVVLTYSIEASFPLSAVSLALLCDIEEGTREQDCYTESSAADMTALIELLNNNECTRRYGTFSALDETTVQLVTSSSFEQSFCSDGTLSFEIFQD